MGTRISHPEPRYSGLTCLANIAAHHGLVGDVRQYRLLAGANQRPADLYAIIQLGRKLGLACVPLEGPFQELPGCPFPVVVPLRENGVITRFVVVLAVEDSTVTVVDPAAGEQKWSHATFCEGWLREDGLGDVLAVSPGRNFQALGPMLDSVATPIRRTCFRLGLTAPWPPKLTWIICVLFFLATTIRLFPSPLSFLVVVCLSASLWSLLFGRGCAACQGAARLAGGLPVALIGFVGYCGLLCLLGLDLRVPALWCLLLAAGAHVTLVGSLAFARLRCIACLITAASAWSGAGYAYANGWLNQDQLMAAIAAMVVTWPLLALARYHMKLAHFYGAFDLTRQVLAEIPKPAEGRVQVVVYKKPDCAHCLLFESSTRPALEAEFGDLLHFEERDARGYAIDVPLVILRSQRDVLVRDTRGDNTFMATRAGILTALGRAADPVPLLHVIG